MLIRLDILGSALSDQSRARMLCALMDGQARTNKELAAVANVTAPTATQHLRNLAGAGLTTSARSGRHIYHRLTGPEVASALEALGQIATPPKRRLPSAELCLARCCYDHLAGRLGVALCDHLTAQDIPGSLDALTAAQAATLARFGVTALPPGPRPAVTTCLDWTERRPHLSGKLGAALLEAALTQGWLTRDRRSLTLTPSGRAIYGPLLT